MNLNDMETHTKVSRNALMRLLREKSIPGAEKIGTNWFFPENFFDNYIIKHKNHKANSEIVVIEISTGTRVNPANPSIMTAAPCELLDDAEKEALKAKVEKLMSGTQMERLRELGKSLYTSLYTSQTANAKEKSAGVIINFEKLITSALIGDGSQSEKKERADAIIKEIKEQMKKEPKWSKQSHNKE